MFDKAINTMGIDFFLKKTYYFLTNADFDIIKQEKKRTLLESKTPIDFMKNAEKLIEYIRKYNINHAVVTNTNIDIVNFFKSKVPLLNSLSNWITREDYNIPKPDPECYEFAFKKYGKGEPYIIGIENNILGYNSLKNVTSCIYIVTNKDNLHYNTFKQEDVYLIDDFDQLFASS
jgi:hypothetical protein